MIHVGRETSDDRAPRMVWRALERWERIARGEAADRLALWVLRSHRAGTLAKPLERGDARRLERWVEHVYTSSHGGVSPVGVGGEGTITPFDIFSGDSTFQSWHRCDLGVTTATGISEWRAQKGGATWTASQATGSLQPAYTAQDATLFARPIGTGDALDDYLLTGWNPPAIATQSLYLRAIVKQNAWTGGRAAFAGSSVALCFLRGTSTSPSVGMRVSAATGVIAMPLTTWYRTETFAAGGTGTDWMRVGSTLASGLTSGTTDASSFSFFGAASGANGAHSLAEVLTCTAEPAALRRALLDGYEFDWYKGAVTAG